MVASLQDDPRSAQHTSKKLPAAPGQAREFRFGPHDEVDLATHEFGDRFAESSNALPVHLANDEHVDVAVGRVCSGSERPEHERLADPGHLRHTFGEKAHHVTFAPQQVPDALKPLTRGIGGPYAQRPKSATANNAGAQQVAEGKLHGVNVGLGAARDLTRVELLARHAGQQSQNAASGSAPPEELSEDRHAHILQRLL